MTNKSQRLQLNNSLLRLDGLQDSTSLARRMCGNGAVGVLTATGVDDIKYGKLVGNSLPEMVMPSSGPIARQTIPTAHRPSLELTTGMQFQLTCIWISVEGAMKRRSPEHLVWSGGMG